MISTPRSRLVSACLALGTLVLLFEPTARAGTQEPRAEQASASAGVYLPQRLSEVDPMPPCTPLRVVSGGSKSSKTTLEHVWGQWGSIKVTTTEFEGVGPADSLGECLATATEYEGRYTEEQFAEIEQGGLRVGMPTEFALMLLGAPESGMRLVAGRSRQIATAQWVREELRKKPTAKDLSKLGIYVWGNTELGRDEAGRIGWMTIRGIPVPAVVVEDDQDGFKVVSPGAHVVSEGSDAAVQADFGRAMEAHASGDHPAALAILLPLAEAGHPPSQYAVGDMYYLGEGVETDPERAADWIGLAAASSVPGALYQLGYMQLRGEGVAARLALNVNRTCFRDILARFAGGGHRAVGKVV